MNKEKSKISQNQKFVSMLSVGGISAIITTNGIIDSNRKLTPEFKKRIEEELSDGLENILDGWMVEGEYRDGAFFVRYIRDDNGKILDIYETKEWAGIMNFGTIGFSGKCLYKDMDKKIKCARPESSFNVSDMRDFITDKNKSWRKRILEKING